VRECSNLIIKVCGLTRQEDATLCQKMKVDLAGFIFHPKSPRCIDPAAAAKIDTGPLMRVGVFVEQSVKEVLSVMDQARLHLAQLHGGQDPDFCARVGKTRVMRVFWPARYGSRQELEKELIRFVPCSRFFLFDGGGYGGGHGQPWNYSLLKGLETYKTWFLAGGLGPGRIKDALASCDPCGLDLNSGVESAPGIKDEDKLEKALAELCLAKGRITA